jgi:hypothetical protein
MPTKMCRCSDCPFGRVHVQAAKFKVGMNIFFENVKNSVSKILTGKEMVYHQRLEEIEDRLRAVEARIESCSVLRAATPVNNVATSSPISSASDHYLSVRSRVSQNSVTSIRQVSYQTEAKMTLCLSVLSNESGVNEASRTSGSGFEHIKAYVGNDYVFEWSCNLEKMDNLPEVFSSVAMASSNVESVEASVGEPDGMGQMIWMEPLVNEEDDCSWSECEHQQDELQ